MSELMAKGQTIREMAKNLKTSKYWIETVVSEVREVNQGGISNVS